ncbi:MAG: hypothetical protein ACTSV0_05705 [Candidatus Freyarchaeota archaeon]
MGERPTGVTILAILMIIWGILALISGFIFLGAFILFPTGLEAIMPIIDIIGVSFTSLVAPDSCPSKSGREYWPVSLTSLDSSAAAFQKTFHNLSSKY